jgi:hypothetical protein
LVGLILDFFQVHDMPWGRAKPGVDEAVHVPAPQTTENVKEQQCQRDGSQRKQ